MVDRLTEVAVARLLRFAIAQRSVDCGPLADLGDTRPALALNAIAGARCWSSTLTRMNLTERVSRTG